MARILRILPTRRIRLADSELSAEHLPTPNIQADVPSATVSVDLRFISRDAILRASYWFAESLIIDTAQETDHIVSIRVSVRERVPTLESPRTPDFKELIADFRAAMLDAELRVRVARETEAVRELILAKAFAEAGVLEDSPPGTFADPVLERSATNHLRILHPDES